jgi:DNA-binding CsgD family transcriptional regulator
MTLHDDARGSSAGETGPAPPTPLSLANIDARIAELAREVRISLRERAVLRLILVGYRYREIGVDLAISPRTVKMHANNLRKKVGGKTRWDLVQRVLRG